MVKRIRILMEAVGEVLAELKEEEAPETCRAIWDSLPFDSTVNRWGDEIYFETPVRLKKEKGRVAMDVGDVAYWPPGRAICIFFGPTPASRRGEPRAYSPVNLFAKIVGDPKVFKRVKDSDKVRVERVV